MITIKILIGAMISFIVIFLGRKVFRFVKVVRKGLKARSMLMAEVSQMYFVSSRFWPDQESGIEVFRTIYCKATSKKAALDIFNQYLAINTNDTLLDEDHICTFNEFVQCELERRIDIEKILHG